MPQHRRCRCGHIKDTHQHFRAGSDCGFCGRLFCARYRRAPQDRWRQTAADWWAWRRAGGRYPPSRRPRH